MQQNKVPTNKFINQKGQTFVIVVMLMVLALTAGVTMSSRFIKGLRNIVTSDDGSKAAGVAESLVERLLVVPSQTLTDYINNNSCGTACTLQITDDTGRALTATATLSFTGNTIDNYVFNLLEDEVSQVFLTGYPTGKSVTVCWDGDTSVVGTYIYSQSSTIRATPFAYNAVSTSHSDNNFANSASSLGYDNCFAVVASQTPLAIRLKSVYGEANGIAIPESGSSIPVQGIQIRATGKAGSAIKNVTVIKSQPFAPAFFDYALYQKSWTDSLSN